MQNTKESSSHQKPAAEPTKQIVLVIDDSVDTLALHKTVLEIEGFQVFTAESGAEAFTLLNEISFPNLILLDMKMEEMSGMEFLDLLEKSRPEIMESVPVVFMTGVDHIPACKASGFIRKPIELSSFVELVHHYIEAGPSVPLKH